jgi:hypothetical protein
MSSPPFVHLHCHSHYSLLDGASKIPELFERTSLLVQRAWFYLRRLRMYETFYEGQEAVDDALAAMYARARRGESLTIQTSADFWREFFYQIRREIRRIGDFNKARKRNPKISAARSGSRQHQDDRNGDEMPAVASEPGWLECELDAFYPRLPSHEALAVILVILSPLYCSSTMYRANHVNRWHRAN